MDMSLEHSNKFFIYQPPSPEQIGQIDVSTSSLGRPWNESWMYNRTATAEQIDPLLVQISKIYAPVFPDQVTSLFGDNPIPPSDQDSSHVFLAGYIPNNGTHMIQMPIMGTDSPPSCRPRDRIFAYREGSWGALKIYTGDVDVQGFEYLRLDQWRRIRIRKAHKIGFNPTTYLQSHNPESHPIKYFNKLPFTVLNKLTAGLMHPPGYVDYDIDADLLNQGNLVQNFVALYLQTGTLVFTSAFKHDWEN